MNFFLIRLERIVQAVVVKCRPMLNSTFATNVSLTDDLADGHDQVRARVKGRVVKEEMIMVATGRITSSALVKNLLHPAQREMVRRDPMVVAALKVA